MSGVIDFAAACAGLAEKECSKALAGEFKTIFVILFVLMLVLVVLQFIFYISKAKKPLQTKTFWLSIAMIDTLMLILIISIYFMMPWLIRVFNIIG